MSPAKKKSTKGKAKSPGRKKQAKPKSATQPKPAPAPKPTPVPMPEPAPKPEPVPTLEAAAGPLLLRATAVTHRGHLRPHNEDCIGVCEWARRLPMSTPVSFECVIDEPRLCIVSDGLGGHAGGEMASVMSVLHLIQSASSLQSEDAVATALREANKVIYESMEGNPELSAMGATVVGVALTGTSAWLFNVGDSRGYVLQAERPLRLASTDDTTDRRVNPRERTGLRQHTISQCLGGQPFFDDIKPHIVPCELAPGDRFLLCSDGLTDMLDQDGIEACLTADGRTSVMKLLTAALDAGGFDNVSIILVDILAAAGAGKG
jgi:PPM family protein phosphatase